MQDKDFDQLFSDKLNSLEVEPSRNVWKGITAELDSRKRKPLGIYLSIAATLLVMFTVGIYFLIRDEQVKPQQQVVVKLKQKAVEPIEAKIEKAELVQKKQPITTVASEVSIAKAKPVHTRKMLIKETVAKHKQMAQPIIAEPLLANEQDEQLAQLPVQKSTAIKFTVPDKTTPFVDKIDEPVQVSTVAVQTVTDEQESGKTLAAAPVRKHKIRGIGDLLNAVVSKIDKRKDKLIEFSSKDEDEPNVTGLNLGFIKIKKQSR